MTLDWPGNARELKHAVERSAILSLGISVGVPALFGDTFPEPEAAPTSLADVISQSERRYIAKALEACDGQLGHTADALGISRKNLCE